MGNQQGSFYRVIPDFDKYEISSNGVIRNVKTKDIEYTYMNK